jgi:hypothetical protein
LVAGISESAAAKAEAGRTASLLTYQRLADALSLDLLLDIVSSTVHVDAEDAVHAAIGEVLARRFGLPPRDVLLDHPYQHFRFAGRGDLVVVDRTLLAISHSEHKTRIPNIGELSGTYNAKCRWLSADVGGSLGIRAFRSETHTLVLLWSDEVVSVARSRVATLDALGRDGTAPFDAWWAGRPLPGRHRGLVVFDPVDRGPTVPRWAGLHEALDSRPRYRGYADALAELRVAGLA